MRASLRVEAIGDDAIAEGRLTTRKLQEHGLGPLVSLLSVRAKHWCAEITGLSPVARYERCFLRGRKDYARANSVGSRGVYVYYLLDSGHLYEVSSPQGWKRVDRYFCTVSEEGHLTRLTEQEARAWLQQRHSNARSA